MQADDFDGIGLLIDQVNGFLDLAKAALSNIFDIFELLLEAPSVQDVLQRRLLGYCADLLADVILNLCFLEPCSCSRRNNSVRRVLLAFGSEGALPSSTMTWITIEFIG